MSDNITLPRAVADELFDAADAVFADWGDLHEAHENRLASALEAFRAALAEPEPTVKDSLTVDATREPATEQQPGAAGMSGAEADRVLIHALRKPCRYPACQDADGRCPRIFAGQCSGPGGVVA